MSIFQKIFPGSPKDQILILDPVEKAMQVVDNQKNKEYSFSLVHKSLLDIFNEMLKVSSKIREDISEIIVINPGNENSEFTEERKNKFFKELDSVTKEKISLKDSNTLLKKFQNCNFLNYTNDAERLSLLDWTRNKKIMFFDFTLSRAIINHLHTDLKSNNILGYCRLDNDSENEWTEIEDVQKYISIAYVLTVETIKATDVEERLSRVKATIEEYFERFLSIVRTNATGKFLIISSKASLPDFYTLRQALSELDSSFYFTECPPESFEQIPEYGRLFIKDVQKLPVHKLFDLCSLSLTKENKNKQIILHSNQYVNLVDFPEFQVYPFFSLNQADEVFQNHLEMQEDNQNIVENLASDLEEIMTNNIKNQNVLKQKLQELNKLKATEKYADFRKFNYWYKMHSLNFPSMELRRKFLLLELAKYFNDIELTSSKPEVIETDWIKFEHKHKKADWEIFNKKGKGYPKQPYMGSKGIKYMAMLVKNYQYPSEISNEDLIKKVNEWNVEKKDRRYKTPKDKLVSMYIRTDLQKIDKNLLFLYKDFKIGDSCYYDPETDLKILIYDEDFPS